jgi:hypothetical protein
MATFRRLTCEMCDREFDSEQPYNSKNPPHPKFCPRCRERLEKAFKQFLDSPRS